MQALLVGLCLVTFYFHVLQGRVGVVSLPFFRRMRSNNALALRGGIAKGDSVKSNSEETDLQAKRKEFFVLRENALGGGDDDDDDRKTIADQDDDNDDSEEVDSSEETSEETSDGTDTLPALSISPVHDQLKDIWRTFIHPPPKLSNLKETLSGSTSNSTEESMYRQFLAQFIDPFAVGGKRVLWLDQETVLRLKGAAVLALNPSMLPLNFSVSAGEDSGSSDKSSSSVLPPRGVRVSIAPVFPAYTSGGGTPLEGTFTFQTALVKALCHSVGSARVSLTRENVNSVRQLAVEQGYTEPIADHHILMALFDVLCGDGDTLLPQPFTVVLQNEELSSWLSRDPLTARVLAAAVCPDKSKPSRLFFMAMPEQAPLTVGQVPPSCHVPVPSAQQQQLEGDAPPFFESSFSFNPFNPQQTPQQSPFLPPQFQMDPSSFSSGSGAPGGPIPMYTVVVQNGSARVIPVGPPHLLPPPPPPEVIQRLVSEAMKKVPEHRRGASFMGSLYTTVSAEDTKALLDENKKLKSIRDRLLKQKADLEAIKDNKAFFPRIPFRMKWKPNNSTASAVTRAADVKPQVASSEVIAASSFEDVVVRPPSDHHLKLKWEKIVDEEMCRRIGKVNKNSLRSELRRSGLQTASGVVRGLREVLRRQVLGEEEVRSALRLAVKLQAGKYNVTAVLVDSGDSNNSVPADVSTASTFVPSSGELVLSLWSLDTALSLVVNAGAQPGRRRPVPVQLNRTPRTRSPEEMVALVASLDKHEKALVSNVISPQEIGVTYDMIGGLDSVKDILRQSITYPLKYPRLYEEGVASEAVKGVLLFGPPGTGKTMLAKAVATEGGATFLTVDAATIENKWLGESEKNAKAVFSLARRLAPCVIYLDEVDSVLSSRESGDDSSHGTLTAVKTTLMQEWDGLRTTKDRVVVIASTNRPFDLDEAVLRRLPRRIMVDLPDLATRREILAVTLRDNRIAAEVNLTVLAEQLEGYTGSDIKEVCREAVVRVSHERAHKLESADTTAVEQEDLNAPLREVSVDDFKVAMTKLKASVSENGRELKKVLEWNEKFGEVKKSGKKRPTSTSQLSMYV